MHSPDADPGFTSAAHGGSALQYALIYLALGAAFITVALASFATLRPTTDRGSEMLCSGSRRQSNRPYSAFPNDKARVWRNRIRRGNESGPIATPLDNHITGPREISDQLEINLRDFVKTRQSAGNACIASLLGR
jgi:hypothetical protein